MGATLFLLILVALVVVYIVWSSKRKENFIEGFKVLGTLGKQNQLYYRCLSECERSDPGKRMTPTHGSSSCLSYCDSVITDLTRRGGSTYVEDHPVAAATIIDRVDESYLRCGDGTHGAYCRQLYATDGEIDEKCRQKCEYSTSSTGECMELCTLAHSANHSRGWSWK